MSNLSKAFEPFEDIAIDSINNIKSFITIGFIPYDLYGNIDWFKILLAFIISIMIIMVILGSIWASVTKQIKNNGRCHIPTLGENPFILAKDRYGSPMYKVSYDLKNRNSKITCECNKGELKNEFEIKVRDLRNFADVKENKVCLCEKHFGLIDNLNNYLYGDQGIIRYIKTGDTSVFNPAYTI